MKTYRINKSIQEFIYNYTSLFPQLNLFNEYIAI